MAKKIIKEAVKKTIKKFKPNPNAPQKQVISGSPEKGTVGAYKGPKAKATPATTKGRGRPKGSTNKAKGNIQAAKTIASPTARKRNARATKSVVSETLKKSPALSTIAKGSAIAGLIGGGAGLGNFILKGRGEKAAQSKPISFGQAFKKARAQGEGTKFTWKGKSYTAVTKDDLKKKGYDANELRQYANRKGKARGPLNRLGQKAKKVLLGKDKKFGGDKGAIDFIRRPKKKASGGMANSSAPKKFKAGGMATKGLGKAYMNSKK